MSCYPIVYVKLSLFYGYFLHFPCFLYHFVPSREYERFYELFRIRQQYFF